MKTVYILLVLVSILAIILCLPDETKKVPVLNIKMEEGDSEPIAIKRYEQETRIERNRLRDIESKIDNDKHSFQEVIALQNMQINKLANLASAFTKALHQITEKKQQEKQYKFLQK